jgi:lon-related putative ATP-dependent protease
MTKELPIEKLYSICDPSTLGWKTSAEAPSLDTIIGQKRAVRALRFGLDISNKGFNIYVAGNPGTGRTTAIERYLNEFAARKSVPSDWCYVNNFEDPNEPNALRLPPGKAVIFQKDMAGAVETAIEDLQAALESDEYTSHKDDLINKVQGKKQDIINRVAERAEEEDFVLQPSPMGLITVPTRAGRPISEDEFLHLSEKEKNEISERQIRLKSTLESATRQAKGLDKELRKQIEKLDVEVARFAIQDHFDELKDKYNTLDEIPEHIDQVREDILENVSDFTKSEENKQSSPFGKYRTRETLVRKYAVNVLVDNSQLEGAPVILEMNPSHRNLIGQVEHEALFGALVTDFTLIRCGCLHRANGGYLVLPVEDVLRNPFAWETLKRALMNDEVIIEDIGERIGLQTKSLHPEPIPLDIKVILIGRPDLYQLLLSIDENFNELFKVKADFDTKMARTDAHIQEYISFAGNLCNHEELRHLDLGALARIVEHASRLADDQAKLSCLFGEMADVIREASYYADQDESKTVSREHVEKSIEERFYRSGMIYEHIQERIARGEVRIDVSGDVVGQVNGLSIINLGDVSFGQPNRITASISLGRDGVMDIEREAELSGPIHTKGVLILQGYLSEKFAQDKPLSLSARLVFEQSYSGVEGDSASSTELYALLSALADLPIKQGIAVTGSVNQKGDVQVIGGVNQKIEGFFEVCRVKGLTGEQGVIIPAGNVTNLMLKQPVLDAVSEGKFHIWTVNAIDEGIEILTGVKAGIRLENGAFETDSVNGLVDTRLAGFAERLVQYGKEKEGHLPAEKE